jgi:hypothetical protein
MSTSAHSIPHLIILQQLYLVTCSAWLERGITAACATASSMLLLPLLPLLLLLPSSQGRRMPPSVIQAAHLANPYAVSYAVLTPHASTLCRQTLFPMLLTEASALSVQEQR